MCEVPGSRSGNKTSKAKQLKLSFMHRRFLGCASPSCRASCANENYASVYTCVYIMSGAIFNERFTRERITIKSRQLNFVI